MTAKMEKKDANELISIILPVYNAEKYIHRCLNSLEAQSYGNIEVIIIDDCSSDNTKSICEAYAERDPRFKIIQTPHNSGAGEARKQGIAVSTGSILGFIDGDDWMNPNFISVLYEKMLKTDADIVSGQALHCNPDGSVFCCAPVGIDITVTSREALIYLDSEGVVYPVLWDKLYRREIILSGEIKSEDCEDAYALTRYIEKASRIAIYTLPLYNYNKSDNALSTSVSLVAHYKYYCYLAKLLYDKYGYSSPLIIKKGIRLIDCAAHIKRDQKIRTDFIAAISESLKELQPLQKSRGTAIKLSMVLNHTRAYLKWSKLLISIFHHNRYRRNRVMGDAIYQNGLKQIIRGVKSNLTTPGRKPQA